MRAIGRGSLASGLRILLDVLRVALWIILAIAGVLAVLGVYVYAAGPADNVLGVRVERIDPWHMTAMSFALAIGALVAALIVVARLRRIFATLSAGDPFVPENAEHLRVIAIVIAVFEIARLVVGAAAAGMMSASDEAAVIDAPISVSVNVLAWFGVLSLVVLSEVFREGARLRDEQKLTI
jgi:TRAP-type C4-dicarboxylate transport system permease small subunit